MNNQDRIIQRKLKVLWHAERTGNVAKTCRYFGIGRASFYRWKAAYEAHGELGLANAKPIPKKPANQTPPEIVEKVSYLRSKYHLGPSPVLTTTGITIYKARLWPCNRARSGSKFRRCISDSLEGVSLRVE